MPRSAQERPGAHKSAQERTGAHRNVQELTISSIGAHARDLERSEAKCAMTSTSFCINFSSRSRSGEVGSRMCDDVDKFCSNSMFSLMFFLF